MSAGVTPEPPLSARLRAHVLRHAGKATLTCEFVPGGKLHGVGIPSVLYCQTCHQARMWHDVAAGAVIAALMEASERLPFDGFDSADVVRAREGSLL